MCVCVCFPCYYDTDTVCYSFKRRNEAANKGEMSLKLSAFPVIVLFLESRVRKHFEFIHDMTVWFVMWWHNYFACLCEGGFLGGEMH